MTHLSHDHKLRFLIRISLFHNHTSDFSFMTMISLLGSTGGQTHMSFGCDQKCYESVLNWISSLLSFH